MKEIANETLSDYTPSSTWRTIMFDRRAIYFYSLAVFFLCWQLVATSGVFGSSMASPYQVARQLGALFSGVRLAGTTLSGHLWASIYRVAAGFLLGVVVGIPLGLSMAFIPVIDALVKPVFNLIKPMPPIAWVSLAILWLGIGESSKIFIIFLGAFPPCLLNAYNGVRLIEPEYYDIIRVLGGKRRSEIIHVCLPGALPALFAGMQIALGSAWSCVLAAELLSSRTGIGFLIRRGMDTQQAALIIGGMIIIAVFSFLASTLLNVIERLLFPWQRSIVPV